MEDTEYTDTETTPLQTPQGTLHNGRHRLGIKHEYILLPSPVGELGIRISRLETRVIDGISSERDKCSLVPCELLGVPGGPSLSDNLCRATELEPLPGAEAVVGELFSATESHFIVRHKQPRTLT